MPWPHPSIRPACRARPAPPTHSSAEPHGACGGRVCASCGALLAGQLAVVSRQRSLTAEVWMPVRAERARLCGVHLCSCAAAALCPASATPAPAAPSSRPRAPPHGTQAMLQKCLLHATARCALAHRLAGGAPVRLTPAVSVLCPLPCTRPAVYAIHRRVLSCAHGLQHALPSWHLL